MDTGTGLRPAMESRCPGVPDLRRRDGRRTETPGRRHQGPDRPLRRPDEVLTVPTVSADVDPMHQFASRLRRARPDVAKGMRAGIRHGVDIVKVDAKARASWSHKIPPTIRSSVAGTAGVVRAGNKNVPIAALYELPDGWRHPLFGNRAAWYPQTGAPRRYLTDAARDNRDLVRAVIAEAVLSAITTVLEG